MVNFRDDLIEELWHENVLCFILLSALQALGGFSGKGDIYREFLRRNEVVFPDEFLLKILGMFSEVEWRGFVVCFGDGSLQLTKEGEVWLSNRFVVDSYRRFVEFQKNSRGEK